jgi:serine/threonine protein kinase
MGTVYAAEHVDIGKAVAIKILHLAYSTQQDLVERFRREARAATRIGHPNIIDVTDFGSTEEGCAYFVMEHLDGIDLADVLSHERRLEPTRACQIAIQICRALSAAHNAGVIHRDLKPENVFLVARDGKADFVKVLDFGIARSVGRARRLTNPGVAMGTPEYMAPEQSMGGVVDHRSDIYSVGALLYEMVTGTAPQMRGGELVRARSLRGELPAEIDNVISRALEHDPVHRHQTMAQLEYELVKGLWGRPRAVAELLGLRVGRRRSEAGPNRDPAEISQQGEPPIAPFVPSPVMAAPAVMPAVVTPVPPAAPPAPALAVVPTPPSFPAPVIPAPAEPLAPVVIEPPAASAVPVAFDRSTMISGTLTTDVRVDSTAPVTPTPVSLRPAAPQLDDARAAAISVAMEAARRVALEAAMTESFENPSPLQEGPPSVTMPPEILTSTVRRMRIEAPTAQVLDVQEQPTDRSVRVRAKRGRRMGAKARFVATFVVLAAVAATGVAVYRQLPWTTDAKLAERAPEGAGQPAAAPAPAAPAPAVATAPPTTAAATEDQQRAARVHQATADIERLLGNGFGFAQLPTVEDRLARLEKDGAAATADELASRARTVLIARAESELDAGEIESGVTHYKIALGVGAGAGAHHAGGDAKGAAPPPAAAAADQGDGAQDVLAASLRERAQAALAAQQNDDAVRLARENVAVTGDDPAAHALLADMLYAAKDYPASAAEYRKAIAGHPANDAAQGALKRGLQRATRKMATAKRPARPARRTRSASGRGGDSAAPAGGDDSDDTKAAAPAEGTKPVEAPPASGGESPSPAAEPAGEKQE